MENKTAMKTPHDMIIEAAENHSFRVPYDGSQSFYDEKALRSFIAGANFAIGKPELWREQGTKFLEWMGKNNWSCHAITGKWGNGYDDVARQKAFTPNELFDLYLEYLKTQQ